MSRRILIVGGSTRAAADSVRRAGWQPICADMFADLDLQNTAEVVPVRSYPESLPDDVAHVFADGWFYCGALENRPDLVERLINPNASYGPLLGSAPDALRRVRDPKWLVQTLMDAGVSPLQVSDSKNPPLPIGLWIQKPLASAGGRSIRVWDMAAKNVRFNEPHYFQRRALGIGLSAIFRVEQGNIEWLGASRELEPITLNHPPSSFSYCGTCGPEKRMRFANGRTATSVLKYRVVTPRQRRSITGCAVFQQTIQQQLTKIARALVKGAPGLRGLIGLDFRLHGGKVWLTEVNPRYTASIEVLELASGRSFLNPDAPGRVLKDASRTGHRLIAKRVLYANSLLTAPDLGDSLSNTDPWKVPQLADVPIPGVPIQPGWPICTVFAEGEIVEAVETEMLRKVSEVQSRFTQSS